MMDAIERFEVAIRCALVDDLAVSLGPFAHLDSKNFPNAYPGQHHHFCEEIRERAKKSSELFVKHFEATYEGFPDLPIWAAAETMSFGTMFTLFKMSPYSVQKRVAQRFSIPSPVMANWLKTLNYVRNLCAHHSRVWNRELAIRPFIPKHDPRWHGSAPIQNDRAFVVLTQLNFLMRLIAPHSNWRDRLWGLFDHYPDVPISKMGIPDDWRQHPLWK